MAKRHLLIDKMREYRDHRVLSPPATHPCGDKRRALVTEHKIAVPLRHVDLDPSSMSDVVSVVENDAVPTIDVYFAIIELVGNTDADESYLASMSDPNLDPRIRAEIYLRRWSGSGASSHPPLDVSRAIVYLQGGPGFGCASPVSGLSLASSKSSWASSALLGDMTNLDGSTFERVILMDQRGTGRSTPISKRSLEKMFPDLFLLDDDDGDDENAENAAERGGGGGEVLGVGVGSARMLLAKARQSKAVADAADHLAKFRADSRGTAVPNVSPIVVVIIVDDRGRPLSRG